MIKLTNAVKQYEGQSLYIQPSAIMTIYVDDVEDKEKKTFVYSVSKDTWIVKETPEEIVKLIEDNK